ncbi:hypothetical protein MY4038_003696 [Beauveria bassiana]
MSKPTAKAVLVEHVMLRLKDAETGHTKVQQQKLANKGTQVGNVMGIKLPLCIQCLMSTSPKIGLSSSAALPRQT